MKHVIFGVVGAILFAVLGALAAQFIGWNHPSTWGPDGRIMAVFLVIIGGLAGGMLGTFIAEKIT